MTDKRNCIRETSIIHATLATSRKGLKEYTVGKNQSGQRCSGMVSFDVPGSPPAGRQFGPFTPAFPSGDHHWKERKGCSETWASKGARPGMSASEGPRARGGGRAARGRFGSPKCQLPPPHPDAGDELFPSREWRKASFPGAGGDPKASCCCRCERVVLPARRTRGGLRVCACERQHQQQIFTAPKTCNAVEKGCGRGGGQQRASPPPGAPLDLGREQPRQQLETKINSPHPKLCAQQAAAQLGVPTPSRSAAPLQPTREVSEGPLHPERSDVCVSAEGDTAPGRAQRQGSPNSQGCFPPLAGRLRGECGSAPPAHAPKRPEKKKKKFGFGGSPSPTRVRVNTGEEGENGSSTLKGRLAPSTSLLGF
ncbi:uncharacterized protein LOC119532638 [Choloepus didactylus]|uniref:uncharacterized protein LOC119532638 n=1 Tax=Choloepus didactylus TaxID=27675 RepID=UPI0018A0B11D|nr:uncharacterized protein LOC119532638 [Choloepus didactylus]